MAYYVDMKITDVDHELGTLKSHGMTLPISFFEDVVVTVALNAVPVTDSQGIIAQLHEHNLNWRQFKTQATYFINNQYEEAERARKAKQEAEQHAEQMRDLYATPEEIAKYAEEKARRKAERIAKIHRMREAGQISGLF